MPPPPIIAPPRPARKQGAAEVADDSTAERIVAPKTCQVQSRRPPWVWQHSKANVHFAQAVILAASDRELEPSWDAVLAQRCSPHPTPLSLWHRFPTSSSATFTILPRRAPKSVPFGDKKCLGVSRDPSEFQDNFKRDPRRLACGPSPARWWRCIYACEVAPQSGVIARVATSSLALCGLKEVDSEYVFQSDTSYHVVFSYNYPSLIFVFTQRRPSRNAARCLPALNNEADFPFAQAALPASDGKSDETANRRIKCGQTGVQASHPHRLVQSTQYLLSIASPLITFIFCGRPRYDTNHERVSPLTTLRA
ncbi:hypothetical protein FB451DRAFT_1559250, partial [Mycena latifolia]